MEFGAITGYVDLAQVLLYAFWLFFAGLIYYLIREGHREGYPMETDGLGRQPWAWPIPSQPKVFKTVHGDVTVPDAARGEAAYRAAPAGYAAPGSPIEPGGNAMQAGVGPGAYAMRADVPDTLIDGHPKIVPLRVATDYGVSAKDPDPRGLPVIGGDGHVGGVVRDLWIDQAEFTFRYLEVETTAASGKRLVLVPMPFAKVRRSQVEVMSIFGKHFADVPGLKNPDQITFLEEERIVAYYGAGTLYADPQRGEPWL